MWFTLIMFVVSFVVSALLAPKPNLENARAGKLGDLRFPRSNEGDPVPLVYGTVRLRAPNTLWYGNFKTVPITEKVKTGLFSSERIVIGYKYYLTIDLALCLGENVRVKRIWAGKDVIWTGTLDTERAISINLPELWGGEKQRGGLVGWIGFYPGSFTQGADPHLQAVLDPSVPRYSGLCHAVFRDFYIGTQLNLEPINFETQRFSDGLGLGSKAVMPNGLDMNPMEIMYDLLTQQWGRLGISPLALDLTNMRAVGNQLYDEGLGMSLAVQSANTGKDLLEEVLRIADGVAYQDPVTGRIRVKLVRQDYDVDTLPVFDRSNVLSIRNFSKSTWADTFNQVRVKFPNRDKDYADGAALAQDFANINFQQRVKSSDVSMPGCFVPDQANRLAARTLAMMSVPLFKLQMVTNREGATLRPGDVFVLNWPPFKLSKLIMRVTRINLGELQNGQVVIDAIQDKFATSTVTFKAPEQTSWQPIDLVPKQVATRRVIDAPYWFLEAPDIGIGGILVLAKQPGPTSVTFDAITTTDNYATVAAGLSNATYTPSGVLSALYPSTVGFATGLDGGSITLTGVDFPEAFGNATAADIQSLGVNLFLVDNEIMAYRTAVVNGDGSVTLTNVYRALLDTTYQDHAAGARVYLLRGADGVLKQTFPSTQAVKVKLRDRTATRLLPLDEALEDALTLDKRSDRPLPPRNLRLNGSRTPAAVTGATIVTATWAPRNRLDRLIRFETDTTATAEVGTDYYVQYRFNGGAWSNIATGGTSYDVPVTGKTGLLEVQVYSRVNNLLSYTSPIIGITLN